MHFSFFKFFTVSRHYTGPTVCVSHFPRFAVSHRNPSAHLSFFTFFSVSRHISCPNMWVSHFPHLSVFSPYSRCCSVCFSFSTFFTFIAILQVLKCAFPIFHFFECFAIFQVTQYLSLIFHVFQFSCHILGPTVCISNFSRFSLFLAIFHVSIMCSSFCTF